MSYSTNLGPGDDALAAQYNSLRLDIFDQTAGHDHDGTSAGGKKISHGDLVDDAAIGNTYLTHARLTKHVQGAGTDPDPDTTGGSVGVHGLSGAAYVAGVTGSMLEASFTAGQLIMQCGYKTTSSTGDHSVTFDTGFSALKSLVLTPVIASPSGLSEQVTKLKSASASGFTVTVASDHGEGFYWVAWGTP